MSETPMSIATGELRAFVERIERVEAHIRDLNADKSEIYKELRGEGFDVKAVRQCVSARKLDTAEREERNAIFDMYWAALNGAPRVHVHEEDTRDQPETATKSQPVEPSSGARPPLAAQRGDESAAPNLEPPPSNPPPAEAQTDDAHPQASSVAIPDDDVPAFLKKPAYVLRPHCLKPDLCAGSGRDHCYSCKKAMAESEAA